MLVVKPEGVRWLLLLGCLWVPMQSMAAPKAEVLDYGYYEFAKKAERVERPLTTSGYVARGEAKLVEKTERIPIQKGRLFGFRFKIWGLNKNVGVLPLELVVEHPKMTKPDGSESTGYHYPLELTLKDGAVEDKAGYRINEDFEMVEGEWRFAFRFMNKTLVEQKFVTYKPEQKAESAQEARPEEKAKLEEKAKPAQKTKFEQEAKAD